MLSRLSQRLVTLRARPMVRCSSTATPPATSAPAATTATAAPAAAAAAATGSGASTGPGSTPPLTVKVTADIGLRPKDPEFDVCVIGAGPAGYAAAMRAWDFGKKVCIIEAGKLGGTAVHNGALTSKTMWEISRDYRHSLRKDRGFVAERVHIDYRQMVDCVEQAVSEKVSQLKRQLQELSHPRPNHLGRISYLQGRAEFLDPYRLHVISDSGVERFVSAHNFVIATGSQPRRLPTIEVDGEYIMTSDHVMQMKSFPRSIVVLGGGVVGCEFATIFANFGQSKVYLIDRADRILPFEDEDISRICSNNLEAKGVTVHHRAQLLSMRVAQGEVEYTIQHHLGGVETIRVERALIAVGRSPNVARVNPSAAGVQLTPNGHIVANDTQTTQPHIYAAGDATEDVALVNVGEIEGRHAIEKLYSAVPPTPLSYDNISTIMHVSMVGFIIFALVSALFSHGDGRFLDPEVAAIGMNEMQAQRKRMAYRVAVYSYSLVNRTIAMRATEGFIKILSTDEEDTRIVGMRALGVHASTTIEAVSLMINHNRSARDLADLLHPHPAVTEGVQDCVRMLLGTSIMKPEVFKSELRLSRVRFPTATAGAPVVEPLRPEKKK